MSSQRLPPDILEGLVNECALLGVGAPNLDDLTRIADEAETAVRKHNKCYSNAFDERPLSAYDYPRHRHVTITGDALVVSGAALLRALSWLFERLAEYERVRELPGYDTWLNQAASEHVDRVLSGLAQKVQDELKRRKQAERLERRKHLKVIE